MVIPFFNEAGNVIPVLEETLLAVPGAEVIAVDDGSTDETWAQICSVKGIRGFRFKQNRGQSAAMVYGLRRASHPLCCTMDGDGQNDPADFNALLAAINAGNGEVAVGRRSKRKDVSSRIIASKIANGIRRRFLNDGVSDTGCSIKIFPRDAVDYLVAFNGQHRFMPAVFLKLGYRICEVEVNHRPRASGASKYTNWERALRGIYDLFGVSWLLNRLICFPEVEQSAR